ncbi:MAG: hypothetical protein GC192_08020 [Bacteroidetes bacterium]|nr:hypothetical protein [Bacteroidota bacterium]
MSEQEAPSSEAIVEEIKRQLEADPALKTWLNKFNKFHQDYFIQHYAEAKRRALMFPDMYVDEFRPMNKEFNELARKSLETIQQMKLFNIQCEWRTGKLKLPFVTLCCDFVVFGRRIMECPFVPPVSWEEVEHYCRFLESPESDDIEFYKYAEWQNYDAIKEEAASETPPTYPYIKAWFRFYQAHHGTEYLLNLPNVKGEKEDYYTKIGYEDVSSKRPPHVHNPEFDKPSPNHYEDAMDFARCYETPEQAEIIINHIKWEKHFGDHEQYDSLYEYLKLVTETIPFVEHEDWKEALRLTVVRFKKRKIIEALPRVWRQYHKSIGDDPEAYLQRRMAEADKDIVVALDEYGSRGPDIKWILEGRRVLGEPLNLDDWGNDEL